MCNEKWNHRRHKISVWLLKKAGAFGFACCRVDWNRCSILWSIRNISSYQTFQLSYYVFSSYHTTTLYCCGIYRMGLLLYLETSEFAWMPTEKMRKSNWEGERQRFTWARDVNSKWYSLSWVVSWEEMTRLLCLGVVFIENMKKR